MNIIAKDGAQSAFSGNYVKDKDGTRPEAIYVDNTSTDMRQTTTPVSVDADKVVINVSNAVSTPTLR